MSNLSKEWVYDNCDMCVHSTPSSNQNRCPFKQLIDQSVTLTNQLGKVFTEKDLFHEDRACKMFHN